MSLIRIENGDWLKNAGIVGLIKVLEYKKSIEDTITIKKDYLEFDSSMLDGFEEAFFKVIISEYGYRSSWYRLISYSTNLERLEKNDITEETILQLNKIIDDIKKTINSNSYKNAYLILEDSSFIKNKGNLLDKIKLKKKENPESFREQVLTQINIINEIIEWLKRDDVKRVIQAKNVMYDVIQNFWNNISILLKTNNKGDMYNLYRNDFIIPTENYINSDRSRYKYSCLTCDNKIKKLNKPESFDLAWIVKMGADMSRKSSHFWNMNGDAYICPVCNLVFSCLPLGFNMVNNKGIFINNNQNLKILRQCNTVQKEYDSRTFEEIENLSYYNVLNAMENVTINNIDKEFDNIQVVKIDASNSRRPYSFNILSPRIMKVLYYNRKRLDSLIKVRVKVTDKYYLNLYDEIISRIYSGRNLFDLISKLLFMYLDNKKFKSISIIYNILSINTSLIGGKRMKQEDINKFTCYGADLKKKYEEKNAEGKLPGITYRLVNAIKTKDAAKFMDSILNAYMYMGKAIPKDLNAILRDSDILQSFGYAFVIGLQGESSEKKNEGVDSNE